MTREELDTLMDLCIKLELERLSKLNKEHPDADILNMIDNELYELDDGDRLVEGLDIVMDAICDMQS